MIIQLRDSAFLPVGEFDDFQFAQCTSQFNAKGSWELTLDASSAIRPLVDFGTGVIFRGDDGAIEFSGPIESIRRSYDGNKDNLILKGSDDNAFLARRLAFPSPSPFTIAPYDVRTGAAGEVMSGYVASNLGPSAVASRQLAGLNVAGSTLGATVTGRARFDNLLELLQGLALRGGDLGFRIVQTGPGALEFQVYQATDRTSTAVFSIELGNLASFDYETEVAETTYAIAGDSGDAGARLFAERQSTEGMESYGLIESFRDQSNTTNVAELYEAALEELAQKADKKNLSVQPTDTGALAYGTGYQMGDRVTAIIDGVATVGIIRELKRSYSVDGTTIAPVIGTPGASKPDTLNVFKKQRELVRRISQLERH